MKTAYIQLSRALFWQDCLPDMTISEVKVKSFSSHISPLGSTNLHFYSSQPDTSRDHMGPVNHVVSLFILTQLNSTQLYCDTFAAEQLDC